MAALPTANNYCCRLLLVAVLFACQPVRGEEAKKSSFMEANSLAAHGQYQPALERYAKAAAEEPKNPAVFHMWGRTLALSGDMHGAVEQYRKAVSLSPKNVELINDLGVALSADGYHEEAINELKRVIELSPKFIAAYNNLGVCLMQTGDYKGAAETFRQSLKLQPKNAIIQKKLQEATAHLQGPSNDTGAKQPAEKSGSQ